MNLFPPPNAIRVIQFQFQSKPLNQGAPTEIRKERIRHARPRSLTRLPANEPVPTTDYTTIPKHDFQNPKVPAVLHLASPARPSS